MDPNPSNSPVIGSAEDAGSQYLPNMSQSTWSTNLYQAHNSRVPETGIHPLSLAHDSTFHQYDDVDDEEEGDETERLQEINNREYERQESISNTSSNGRKAAWGGNKHSRRSSSSSVAQQPSARSKEKQHKSPRPSKGHQLRSTNTSQRINYRESTTASSSIQQNRAEAASKSPRTSHNLVEKQYRTRLNGQFSTLLECLPPEMVGAEIDDYNRGGDGAEKRVSKAEVLVLAKKHIGNLEREKKALESDKKALLEDVKRLRGVWTGMQGGVRP